MYLMTSSSVYESSYFSGFCYACPISDYYNGKSRITSTIKCEKGVKALGEDLKLGKIRLSVFGIESRELERVGGDGYNDGLYTNTRHYIGFSSPLLCRVRGREASFHVCARGGHDKWGGTLKVYY
jgi:hypothetical protein